MMQIIVWILGIVSAYRLWENKPWLSVVVILLVLSYQAHQDEQHHQNMTGEFPQATATRFMLSTIGVVAIFVYSLIA